MILITAISVLASLPAVVYVIVGELYLDTFGVAHYMVICYDIPVAVDNEAGAQAFLPAVLGLHPAAVEEVIEKWRELEEWLHKLFLAHCGDVYHGGIYRLDHIGKGLLRSEDVLGDFLDRRFFTG